MLRALEPYDVELLYEVENDVSLWHLGSANMPYSREFLQNYILSTTGDIYTDRQLRLVIEEENMPVGLIDLQNFEPKHHRAEVGIVILPAFRHRGYAYKALLELEDYCRSTLQLHQVHALVPESNIPSVGLFHKAEFVDVASLKDWLYHDKGYEDAVLLQKLL